MSVCAAVASPEAIDVSCLGRLYVATLNDRGYQPLVVQAYTRSVEHFVDWLGIRADHLPLDESLIRSFVEEHLPVCECAGRKQKGKTTVRPALEHLAEILRLQGMLTPQGSREPKHIRGELDAFCVYAKEVCGFAPSTLISRRMWVSRFLGYHFPTGGIALSKLGPTDMGSFFTVQCRGFQPGSAQVVAGAVRSYLRFRALRNEDHVEALMAAIPAVARWRLAALPESLPPDDVTKLLASCDRQRPQGQRDYAILRCLVDLGLRSCEAAGLRLDDLDWRQAMMTIRKGKSRRADVLPLPSTTGEAIAEYLHSGRCHAKPPSDNRAVFIRHRAPRTHPLDTSVIRSVVRQAAARSGLDGRLRGPHLLRHSAATRMLHGGASLKEIADVLRHRSLDTTAVYAKVDIVRLSAIAQPWPKAGGKA
jgi:site-specific recombinase XerD